MRRDLVVAGLPPDEYAEEEKGVEALLLPAPREPRCLAMFKGKEWYCDADAVGRAALLASKRGCSRLLEVSKG